MSLGRRQPSSKDRVLAPKLVPEAQATLFETHLVEIYLESTSRARDEMVFSFSQISSLFTRDSLADLEAKIAGDSVCRGGSNIAYDIGMMQMASLELNYGFLVVHVCFVWSS
jgi:hypothetical protein